MSKTKTLPRRDQVAAADTWDLASLFADDAAWETAFRKWERRIGGYNKFRGRLSDGPQSLAAALKFDLLFDRAGESLGNYAFLKTAEDQSNSDYQRMVGRYQNAASRAAQAASYMRPEILAIAEARMKRMLAHRALRPYRTLLLRMHRYKKHTLSKREEHLLAMQSEMSSATNKIFTQLNNSDLKFGTVKNERGEEVELGHASFSSLLHSSKRAVRKTAFHQYYAQFKAHENTLAATLSGSIHRDVYYAKARGYKTALEAALFPDNVPQSVYDNLIAAVGKHLPAVHRYFDLRRRKMKLPDIRQYDTYVPILSDLDTRYTWDQAVQTVIDSLSPLGSEYCTTLAKGLKGRWCDRYPNVGKQSGAFSSGAYDGQPYILMNYQEEVLDHVFTLAHEAGHSMHTHFSAAKQPFQYYDYTIFVAEVASTFNEQLLSRHLQSQAKDDRHRAYLINRDIDALRATVVRQTMFAEFERIVHAHVEAGEPLTVESFKTIYRGLLERYFGPDFAIDDELSLECFRIPHFYRAYYVYKYATGLSAAVALADRVTGGGKQELADYLGFLSGGSSQEPLDLLRGAGVDMTKPEPVAAALTHFGRLVDELDALL
ncbi:MAG: oligoendopeptidase F [Pirellulales bacterium]